MSRQQIDRQIAFLRLELTRITQELAFTEEPHAQALRIRQNRLSAELHRLESILRDGITAPGSTGRSD